MSAMEDDLRLVSHAFPAESTGATATHVMIEGAMGLPSERCSMVTGIGSFLSTTITGAIEVESLKGTTSEKTQYSVVSEAVLSGNVTMIPSPSSGALSSRIGATSLSGGVMSPLLSTGDTRTMLSSISVRKTLPLMSWTVIVTYSGMSGWIGSEERVDTVLP